MTAQEQFRRAAELIEEHGHCRMQFSGPNGEMCMARALAVANGGELCAVSYETFAADRKVLDESPAIQQSGLILDEICGYNNSFKSSDEAPAWLRYQADRLDRVVLV